MYRASPGMNSVDSMSLSHRRQCSCLVTQSPIVWYGLVVAGNLPASMSLRALARSFLSNSSRSGCGMGLGLSRRCAVRQGEQAYTCSQSEGPPRCMLLRPHRPRTGNRRARAPLQAVAVCALACWDRHGRVLASLQTDLIEAAESDSRCSVRESTLSLPRYPARRVVRPSRGSRHRSWWSTSL